MKINKECKCCGAKHTKVPATARLGDFGYYYWECACKSTLCASLSPEHSKALLRAFRANLHRPAVSI